MLFLQCLQLMKEKFRSTFPSDCCGLWSLLMMPRSKSAVFEVKKLNYWDTQHSQSQRRWCSVEDLFLYLMLQDDLVRGNSVPRLRSQSRSRISSQDLLSDCYTGLCSVFNDILHWELKTPHWQQKKPPTISSFQYFHWATKWICSCWIA